MGQIRVGRDGRLAVADAMVRRHDHRHLRCQPDALAQRGRARDVGGLGIERGERRDRRAQHVHGVGGLDGCDDVEDRRRQPAGAAQLRPEALELRLRGQLAVQQQVGRLLEGGVLRQVVDGVAAVAQFAGLAVDERRGGSLEVHILQAAVDLGRRSGVVMTVRLLLDRARSPCYEGYARPETAPRRGIELDVLASSMAAVRGRSLGWFYPRARTSASCVRPSSCCRLDLSRPILIGTDGLVRQRAAALGLDLAGCTVRDPALDAQARALRGRSSLPDARK